MTELSTSRRSKVSASLVDMLASIPDAYDFLQLFFPDIQPYRWQIEELVRLSGYADPSAPNYEATRFEPSTAAPLIETLCAANGSGKDQIVLTVWGLYCLCCKRDFHWIATSASYNQLDKQTWFHIEKRAQQLNQQLGRGFLRIKKHEITCAHTGSKITLFRSDESGRIEGFHPMKDGAPMAIVLNEVKTLTNEEVVAFKRCHGYTHWLNISSPGDPVGYFYDACTDPRAVKYPAPMIPGVNFVRRVDYTLCPHLKDEYERDVQEFGADDPYIRSSYNALFTSSEKLYIIRPEWLSYENPPRLNLGFPRTAGLDLSLGGDNTVLSVWENNYLVQEWSICESHEPSLTAMVVDKIHELQIPASGVYVDAGGVGTSIIHRIREAGLNVNGVFNNGAPRNKKAFKNRGAELAFNFRRLILDKVLNLQGISPRLRREMGARYYMIKDGKKQLEDKKEFRARHGYSPDYFDAAILAFAGTNAFAFRAAKIPPPDPAALGKVPINWKHEMDEIYGQLDNDANRGQWRTSGLYSRRKLNNPVRRPHF